MSWEYKKLSSYQNCVIIMGQSPSSETFNYSMNGLPFLQGKAEFGYKYPVPKKFTNEPLKLAEKNDILISVRAPVGDVNICPYKICIGRGLASIRFENDVALFYYYWFQMSKEKIENMGMGSTFKAITIEQLKNIEIPVPSIEEKTKIVTLLNLNDEAIQKADEAIYHSERIKKGLMQKLLVNDTWESKSISEIGKVITGKTPSTSNANYWNGDIPFITPGDINDNIYISNAKRFVTVEGAKSIGNLIPQNSIVAVCIGSTTGKIGLTNVSCITNQQINSIIVDNKNNNPIYIYYALSLLSTKIRSMAGIAALPIINKSLFETISIPIPEIEEQNRIAKILFSIDKKIELEKQRKQSLEKIKKAIMEDLLTGRKSIKLN